MDNNNLEQQKEDENLGSFYMGRMRRPPEPKRQMPAGRLAALALAVLGGVIWYAYPRGPEMYVDKDVPVVKADAGPIREVPADPGGMEVRHQDSTVFEPLEEITADKAEKLQPLPETPVDKDQAMKVAAEESSKVEPAAEEAPDLTVQNEGNGVEKLVAAPEPAPVAEPAKPVVAEKPKKPEKAVKTAKAGKKEKAAPVSGKEVYMQLGSYRDVVGAQKDWGRLKKKYPDMLGKLDMRTVKVDLPAKGTFYRLQAGKVAESKGKEICLSLKTTNPGGCIVVR